MVYSTEQEVRLEAGNILNTEYTDPDILKKIKGAYSTVQLAVGRTLINPFDALDAEYEYARELEIKIATKNCLKAYGPEFLDKVKELEAEIKADIEFLQNNIQEISDTGDVDVLLAVTPYLSYGAAMDENPQQTTVAPYRSGLTDSV